MSSATGAGISLNWCTGIRPAKHYFCKKCGIYPFHETVRAPSSYRVNLGCIDEIDVVNLPFDVFDGKHLL